LEKVREGRWTRITTKQEIELDICLAQFDLFE